MSIGKSERLKYVDIVVCNYVIWLMGVSFFILIFIVDVFVVSVL